MSAALDPIDNEALEFLRRVVPAAGGFNLVAIDPDREQIVARAFTVDTIDLAPAWIEARQRERKNIYWSVNPLKSPLNKKAEKTDVAAMAWLHVDIDDTSDGVLERLRAYRPAPSCVVFSGGGYQGFWKLEEPAPLTLLNGSRDPQEEDYNRYIEHEFAADHCHNIDRIMRVPGTVNWPNKKKRDAGRQPVAARLIEFHDERRYELADFTPMAKQQVQLPRVVTDYVGEDRSADLLKRVGADVRDGMPDYQIIAKHREHPHAQDQSDADRAVRRCIDRARSEQQPSNSGDTKSDPLADIRASIVADLAAGPDAIDAATPPQFVVYPHFPVCGSNLAGGGGTNKTTTTLNEYVAITAGGELYGQPIDKQGNCVIVTAEDGAGYVRYLQQRVIADGAAAGAFPDSVVKCAKASMPVISWPRAKFGPIVYVDQLGGFHRAPQFDLLLELLAPIKPVVVTLDPAVLFSPGERYVNDGDAFLASMIHEAALTLGCCFQLIDHVSQNVARSGIIDQYAARGGTAKTDNARMARQLVVHKQEEKDAPQRHAVPFAVRPEDISEGRLLQMHWTKLNYAKKPAPVWLLRSGYLIQSKRPASDDQQHEAAADARSRESAADVETIVGYITEKLAVGAGIRMTQNDLCGAEVRTADGIKLTRARVRDATQTALATRRLVRHDLPASERKGSRTQFLAPP